MSFGSWFKGLGSSLIPQPKAAQKFPRDPRTGFSQGGPLLGPSLNGWTDSRTDQVRGYRHWTYVAIHRISSRIASLYPNVGSIAKDPSANTDVSRSFKIDTKSLHPVPHGAIVDPVDYHHPLVRLLASPNAIDNDYDLWYETVLFLLLTGNAYWWVPKNKVTGLPAAIWVLPSHWVFPNFDKDGILYSYDLRPDSGGYLRREFEAEDVIHIRYKNPISKIDGYSPQTAIAQWVDTQLSVDRSRWYTFKNGAFPSAALEFSGDYSDPTEDDLARIEQKFLSRYAGETRAGKPLLLPPGVKFTKISLSPSEMDYTKSSEQIRDQILAGFGVPALIAGIVKDMTYGSILAANVIFCTNAINPILRMLSRVLTEHLARPIDPNLIIYFDDSTPNDPELIEKQIKTDLTAGAITPEEVRRLRGRQPYKYGGRDPLISHLGLLFPWGTNTPIEELNPQIALTNSHSTAKIEEDNDGRPPGPETSKPDKEE